MKIFLVGGAVRDILLGYTPRDHDYVVLDSSKEEMLKHGFIQVGASYEVFLHPVTKDEHVLASDLYEDLRRRDLTINSMAMDESGTIIDPFNGRDDLKQKILRHTSEHFSDDPLRVYRIARFSSQYPDFSIAKQTIEICKTLIKTSEFKNLNGQRIQSELAAALLAKKPSLFFETLNSIGALHVHFSEIKNWSILDNLKEDDSLYRFAALVQDVEAATLADFFKRLMIPNNWQEAGMVANRFYPHLDKFSEMAPSRVVELFYEVDAFRKPYLVDILSKLYGKKADKLLLYFKLINQVSARDIGPELSGKAVGVAIKQERIRRLAQEKAHKA